MACEFEGLLCYLGVSKFRKLKMHELVHPFQKNCLLWCFLFWISFGPHSLTENSQDLIMNNEFTIKSSERKWVPVNSLSIFSKNIMYWGRMENLIMRCSKSFWFFMYWLCSFLPIPRPSWKHKTALIDINFGQSRF